MKYKISNLTKAINDGHIENEEKEELFKSLNSNLGAFINYYIKVVNWEMFIKTAEIAGESKQSIHMKMNEECDECYNACISACKEINSLCERFNIDYICPTSIKDRDSIARFCGEVSKMFYTKGIG